MGRKPPQEVAGEEHAGGAGDEEGDAVGHGTAIL